MDSFLGCINGHFQSSKDMGEIDHHIIPLLCEGFLEKKLQMTYYSIISLFFHHGSPLGMEREIVPK